MKMIALLLLFTCASSLDNGLGRTPPMGWNSWNHFACKINETIVKQTADLLVSTGLAAKGYKYLNIDDCWQISRNESTKQIIPDQTRFPNGMAVLAQYAHKKGLLFGLYSDAGTKTCQGRPGGYGHQEIDAATYAKWKVDYLKYDNCHNQGLSPKFRYPLMRDALNKTGRPIYFSLCEWGRQKPYEWAQSVGNSWRTTIDIKDLYESFIHNLQQQVGLSNYAGPGAWNDPDMLEVGNGGMNTDQYQSHFVLWAALKSPLMIGCSLSNISKTTLDILGNQEVIAINQDPLGRQADLLKREEHALGYKEIWGGELSNNRYVLIFFNRGTASATFSFGLQLGEFRGMKVVGIRDVLEHANVELPKTDTFTSKAVKKHAVAAYVLSYGQKVSVSLAQQ